VSGGIVIGTKEDGPHAGEFDFGLFIQLGFGTGLDVGAGGLIGLTDNADGRTTTASMPGIPDPAPILDFLSLNFEFSPESNEVVGENLVIGPNFGAGSISDSLSIDVTVREGIDFIQDLFSAAPEPAPSSGAAGGFLLYPSKPNLNALADIYEK
jgi:hypothetical protein